MAETGSVAHDLFPRVSQEESAAMVQAPGRLHIGGSAYFVWADPPNGGCAARRPIVVHRCTISALSTSKQLLVTCEGGLAQDVGPPNFPWGTPSPAAPQARGVHGLHRHAKYPTVWERNDGTDIAQALSCTHNTPCFQGERGRQLWHWDNVSSPAMPVKL